MSVPNHIPGYRKTLFAFKVMYSGWECDDDAWVIELKSGRRALVMSNHCHEYIADIDELHEKLAEYRRVAVDTEKAIKMLAEHEANMAGENKTGK